MGGWIHTDPGETSDVTFKMLDRNAMLPRMRMDK